MREEYYWGCAEGGAGTSQPSKPVARNYLWIQAVRGRGKSGSMYGTVSLASEESVYSRAPPPPVATEPDVTTSTYSLEQIIQILVTLQGQMTQVTQVLDTCGMIPATTTSAAPASTTVPPAPAPPSTSAPPTPVTTSTTAPPVPIVPGGVSAQDLQRVLNRVLTQLYACGQPSPTPPPPPPAV